MKENTDRLREFCIGVSSYIVVVVIVLAVCYMVQFNTGCRYDIPQSGKPDMICAKG